MSAALRGMVVGDSLVLSQPHRQLKVLLQPLEGSSQVAISLTHEENILNRRKAHEQGSHPNVVNAAASGTSPVVRQMYMLAAGSGITPMMQILRYCLGISGLACDFVLITANKTPEHIPFREELQKLRAEHPLFVSMPKHRIDVVLCLYNMRLCSLL